MNIWEDSHSRLAIGIEMDSMGGGWLHAPGGHTVASESHDFQCFLGVKLLESYD